MPSIEVPVQVSLLRWRMKLLVCSPGNHAQLDLQHAWELRFWCAHLGVSPTVLTEAVRVVGCYLGDVVNHLSHVDDRSA